MTLGLRARIMRGDLPPWLMKHPRRQYIIQSAYARVPWADHKKIHRIYREARARGYVVDHEIPLTHPYVCGLTVHNNLRAIPRKSNAAKSNEWSPDQIDFLPREAAPHQLSLASAAQL